MTGATLPDTPPPGPPVENGDGLAPRGRRLPAGIRVLGPGLITGAADDDPSGISTYSMAGAAFGYALLWTALFTLPLMAAVQLMCARIGMVTGEGLAGVLRRYYPRWLLLSACALLLAANTVNIGADLGAMERAGGAVVPVHGTRSPRSRTAWRTFLWAWAGKSPRGRKSNRNGSTSTP